MRARNKILLAMAVLAVIAVPLLLRDDSAADESPMAAAGVAPLLPASSSAPSAPPPRAARRDGAPAPRPAAPPVFDSVQVEKEEVCQGEENLVTVRAHTTDGNDAYL